MVSLRQAAVAFFAAFAIGGAVAQVHAEEELVTITATRTQDSGPACEGLSVGESSRLAREAETAGAWQRASDCFVAAGEYTRAHRASTRAAGEAASVHKRNASMAAETAKSQMARIRAAFR